MAVCECERSVATLTEGDNCNNNLVFFFLQFMNEKGLCRRINLPNFLSLIPRHYLVVIL